MRDHDAIYLWLKLPTRLSPFGFLVPSPVRFDILAHGLFSELKEKFEVVRRGSSECVLHNE
jgi:hypothetical protein